MARPCEKDQASLPQSVVAVEFGVWYGTRPVGNGGNQKTVALRYATDRRGIKKPENAEIGRGERVRTSDSCVPNAVLYQAELHPELKHSEREILNTDLAIGWRRQITREPQKKTRGCAALGFNSTHRSPGHTPTKCYRYNLNFNNFA